MDIEKYPDLTIVKHIIQRLDEVMSDYAELQESVLFSIGDKEDLKMHIDACRNMSEDLIGKVSKNFEIDSEEFLSEMISFESVE